MLNRWCKGPRGRQCPRRMWATRFNADMSETMPGHAGGMRWPVPEPILLFCISA